MQKRALIVGFNQYINSKNGDMLPLGDRRLGAEAWLQFEGLLTSFLLNHQMRVFHSYENPRFSLLPSDCDKYFFCHQNRSNKSPQTSFFYMQMHMREFFTLDRQGWGVSNFRKNHLDLKKPCSDFVANKVKLFQSGVETKIQQNLLSKVRLGPFTNLTFDKPENFPEKFVFVPLQVRNDFVIKNHSPVKVDEFVRRVSDWAKSQRVNIIIKPHPYNLKDVGLMRVLKDVQSPRDGIYISTEHVHGLIKQSIGLFLINSGVGFESLMLGRPVVTFGDADYTQAVFKGDIERIGDGYDYLLKNSSMESAARYRRFCESYLDQVGVFIDDPQAINKIGLLLE